MPSRNISATGSARTSSPICRRSRRLSVVARNTAFTFKGQSRRCRPRSPASSNVSHVLEGSVRKAGGRVRITAQLIDGASRRPCLGRALRPRPRPTFSRSRTRFPRRSSAPCKLKLLPEEKKAIEHRGTTKRRGLQPLSDGAATLDHRQLRRRPPRRGGRAHLPAGDRARPRLCPRLGADGARPGRDPVSAFAGRGRACRRPNGRCELDPNLPEAHVRQGALPRRRGRPLRGCRPADRDGAAARPRIHGR